MKIQNPRTRLYTRPKGAVTNHNRVSFVYFPKHIHATTRRASPDQAVCWWSLAVLNVSVSFSVFFPPLFIFQPLFLPPFPFPFPSSSSSSSHFIYLNILSFIPNSSSIRSFKRLQVSSFQSSFLILVDQRRKRKILLPYPLFPYFLLFPDTKTFTQRKIF